MILSYKLSLAGKLQIVLVRQFHLVAVVLFGVFAKLINNSDVAKELYKINKIICHRDGGVPFLRDHGRRVRARACDGDGGQKPYIRDPRPSRRVGDSSECRAPGNAQSG